MIAEKVNFCPQCGASLMLMERVGRVRPGCPECGWVFFPDPKVAAAVLVEQDGRVLLGRRVNDPARGQWTMPAGFIDAGEDPAEAAVRECLEETGLFVRITGLLDVLSGQEHARGAHIVIFYRAEIVSGELRPGDDVDAVRFFDRHDLPPLAFSTTERILARY